MSVPTRKVTTTAIEQARRALQHVPEYTAKEVPKVQAIRSLLPDIHQMLSKGYDWGAVASLLSEQGIVVTTVTLKSYVQQAKTTGGKKARRKRSLTEGLAKGGAGRSPEASNASAEGAAKSGSTRSEKAAPTAPPTVSTKAPSAELPKSKPIVPEATARRSAFVPEEDDNDI